MSHLSAPPPLTRPPSMSVSHVGGHSRFKRLQKIGEGSFGDVFKALDTETNEVVAIKVINLEEAEEEIDEIRQEITMLSECQSPYVTKYITSYSNGPDLCIVMEYLGGGSVHELLENGPLDESVVAVITRELLKAVEYLHANGKIHRDIKAANILLSSKGEVKISDFGVTAKLTHTVQKRNTFVGTPFWMAPEVIKQSDYNEKADIWSIGITVLEMFEGHPPFHDVHPMKALFLIPKAEPPTLESHQTASRNLKDFVQSCLQKEHAKRPSVKQLLTSKWIRGAKKNALLQDLVMERQLRVSGSKSTTTTTRGGGGGGPSRSMTSAAAGINEDGDGEEMIVEEGGYGEDGEGGPEDSWSFTVRQPSTTAAAAAAAKAVPAPTPSPAPAPVAAVLSPPATSASSSRAVSPSPPVPPARPSRASITALHPSLSQMQSHALTNQAAAPSSVVSPAAAAAAPPSAVSPPAATSPLVDMGTVKGPAVAAAAAAFNAAAAAAASAASPPRLVSFGGATVNSVPASLTNTIRRENDDDISSGSGGSSSDDDDDESAAGYGTVRQAKPAAAAPPAAASLFTHAATNARGGSISVASDASDASDVPPPPPPQPQQPASNLTSPSSSIVPPISASPPLSAAAASSFQSALAAAVTQLSSSSSSPSTSAALQRAQEALLALDGVQSGLAEQLFRLTLGASATSPTAGRKLSVELTSPNSGGGARTPTTGTRPGIARPFSTSSAASVGASNSPRSRGAPVAPGSGSGAGAVVSPTGGARSSAPDPAAASKGFSNVKNLWQQLEKEKAAQQQQGGVTPTKAAGGGRN